MSLQDELRAAAQESEDYSLLTRAADALDRTEPEQAAHRANLEQAAERIRALLVLPNMTDRVNGDPMFILGWEAASEEVLARTPEIMAALTDEPSDTNWGDQAGVVL